MCIRDRLEAARERADRMGSQKDNRLVISHLDLLDVSRIFKPIYRDFLAVEPEVRMVYKSGSDWATAERLEEGGVDVAFTFLESLEGRDRLDYLVVEQDVYKRQDERGEHVPGTVEQEAAQKQQPEGQGAGGLGQSLGVVRPGGGGSGGGQVQAGQIALVRQRDEQAGDDAHHQEENGQHHQGAGQGHGSQKGADHRGEHYGGQSESGGSQAGRCV